jgi:superoxide dismutase, Cu-Zn family
MMKMAVTLVSALALSGCASMAAAPGETVAGRLIASGEIRTANGQSMGSAEVREAPTGALSLSLSITRYPLGVYGAHVHSVGRCEGPGFTSAGPHWNPTTRQHGRLNAMGTHHGDLPNLTVGQDGIVMETYPLSGTARGDGGLLDADGAAFIIHASPDDERTDPTGNSGARIACAVLTPR